jgi:flagellin
MSTINYNIAANIAANNLNRNERLLDQTMGKLSSGQQVGVGHNAPGTLGLYNRLKTEGSTVRTGLDSINNALAQLKLVESTAMTMQSMMVRMQELSTLAANAATITSDRYALDAEFGMILTELVRLTNDTQFNSANVMQGTDITVFTGEATAITVTMDDFRITNFVATTGLEIATGALVVGSENSGGGATAAMNITVVAAAGAVPATKQENLTTSANATATRAKLVNMLPNFSEAVSRVGGYVNALEFAAEAQAGKAVALEAGASQVGDTDYAVETAILASSQVVSQAATAILAQANARASTVLTLLK